MSYVLWQKENGGPEFQNDIELSSVNSVKFEEPVRSSPEDTHVFQEISERPSVKFRRFRKQGVRQRKLEMEASAEHSDVETAQTVHSNLLRIIKIVALFLIAACTLVGTVFSKITFVSITSRMYDLTTGSGAAADRDQSQLFVQLVFILVVPEVVCFLHCLTWGVIGKTDKTFPWPTWKAILLGFFTSVFEVAAICGFVFGVACRFPPGFTILLLNGVFWFVIAKHFFWDMFCRKRHGYNQIPNQYNDEGTCTKIFKRKIVPVLELLGFILQIGTLIAIPILLSETDSGYTEDNYHPSTLILLPVTLSLVSLLWSGWVQEKLMEPSSQRVTVQDELGTARLKSGLLSSMVRIILFPFVAYGYANLLDFNLTLDSNSFIWNSSEFSTFLTHILVTFVAYLFAWIACALQSWAFFVPMLLSTPISFVWYVGSVEANELFPFEGVYNIDWNLEYFIYLVAALLWGSQFLAFGYYIFQSSDAILASDEDLFWSPRYNGVFLEQHLILNRKTEITGFVVKDTPADPYRIKNIAKDSHIFICSTMYHENEVEMRQMLKSINRMAVAAATESRDNHKYESHVFFDNACSGDQLSMWVMQLLGLLKETLNVEPSRVTKLLTPYGMQLEYNLRGNMPFYVHLKDNSRVKNKKRWSQVMYMNYVLNYRIKYSEIPKDKAFILTTDADIDFTSDSVVALLDILARDDRIGAVCARTHPLGNGPVVWYQIFDYAIGHWFQKAAEHILGCVLCCPGCFSVFRVSAIEEVLSTYSSSVETGFDFLTKDMGEDRWLCTLLIQKGWRLEYSAVSQDSTYCPESFEEFYKQRRRWIPSTIANLAQVIGSYGKITSSNDSISIMFIMYEFLMVFSSLISPATVILIIVTGLTALDDGINDVALIIVLCIVSVLYGAVCVYATEKTQIDVAKVLTLLFSIVMGIVMSGILTDTISAAIEGDPLDHVNRTSDKFRFPVDISAIYFAVFALTFTLAGLLHFNEIFCLLHFIWYLLCLPSGYLFLIIYSMANINNRSWGTREGAIPGKSSKSVGWIDYLMGVWHGFLDSFCTKCFGRKSPIVLEDTQPAPTPVTEHLVDDLHPEPRLDKKVERWLKDIECDMYSDNFEKEGYTEMDFIAAMKTADLIAIGIDKRGYLLKLEKEVKKLNTPELHCDVPPNVMVWLDSLKLSQYKALFKSEGYYTDEDVENLKGLAKKELQAMGITRRAHLHQLISNLRYLQYPTDIEIQTNKTRTEMERVEPVDLYEISREIISPHLSEESTDKIKQYKQEYEFWQNLADTKLKPESANLGKVEELKEKLNSLRNLCLLVLLLVNIMWIVFLYTLVFPQLTDYNLPDRAFSLLFLGIFSVIILIQFGAMIFHRIGTLVHLLARTKLKHKKLEANWFQPSDVDTISRAYALRT